MPGRLIVCLIIAVIAAPPAAAQQWEGAVGPNLVENPSFEDVREGSLAAWSYDPAVFGPDQTVASSGARSLRFVNHDPDRYVLCTQVIPLEPGHVYELRARIRTQGIAGRDTGATVCLEWSDAEGRYLGGYYPEGVGGDTLNWTEIGGLSPPVPAGAARATVSCYVRRGMTGTAWWDEVSVRRWRRRPMVSILTSPSYRGWIWDHGPGRAEARVTLLDEELDAGREGVQVVGRLVAAGGRVLAERPAQPGPGRTLMVSVPLPADGEHEYLLEIRLLDGRTGEVMAQDEHRLTRRTGPPPRAYVDEHNRLILEGEPFFPLGMYWSGMSEAELAIYQEAPFNCLMPYQTPSREQMDLAHRLGLRVIYTIKDLYYGTRWCPDYITSEADEEPAVRRTVREFRDHPALLAWYINDERPLSMLDRLKAHQRWVEEEDPNHPTWAVLYQVDEVDRYVSSFDVIGTDPYPIPDWPASLAGRWARLTREGVAGARAMWMVPQVFRWPERHRPPTFAELRSMTWQCIAEGAMGIVFYSWFDLRADQQFPFEQRWPEVRQVAQEVADMIPVLLSVEPVPALEVAVPEEVHWTARTHEGITYIILASGSEEAVIASVRLSYPQASVVVNGRPLLVSDDGRFTVEVEPLGVAVCRVAVPAAP